MLSSIFVFLTLLLPLTSSQPSSSLNRLTLDSCLDSSECLAPRVCIPTSIPLECAEDPASASCMRCIPPDGLKSCTTADDCPSDESCFASPNLSFLVCMSTTAGPANGAKLVGDSQQSRLTLDICSVDQDCASERTCKFIAPGITLPCENRTKCQCLSTSPVYCESSDICDEGEACTPTSVLGDICVSQVVADEAGIPPVEQSGDSSSPADPSEVLPPPNEPTLPPSTDIPINQSPDPEENTDVGAPAPAPTTRPGPAPSGNGTNLAMENCESDRDCLPSRKCLPISDPTPEGNPMCETSGRCVCRFSPIPPCQSDDDCTPGEVCSLAAGTPEETCVSKAVIDAFGEQGAPINVLQDSSQPQETEEDFPMESGEPQGDDGLDEGVCVDIDLLSHLDRKELVFNRHRRARVLCDRHGSCATAGHMVIYEGKSMMMRRYCDTAGCVEKIMSVNSPLRRRGTLIASRSNGLAFTAFAARYGTKLEEVVLRIAVHLAV